MSVTQHDLELAIQNVECGSLSVELGAAVCRQSQAKAVHMAQERLHELRREERLLTNGSLWRLADLVWELVGEECIPSLFDVGAPEDGMTFLAEKLERKSDSFSDESLQLIVHRCWDKRGLARLIQSRRIGTKALQIESQSVELTGDIAAVKRRVSEYSFNPDLNALLQKVEDGLLKAGDAFDQAALLKHLRTFFEELHEAAGKKLQQARPETVNKTDLTKCGQAIDYLQQKAVLKEKMKDLGRALYGILSEEGVHAIKSKKEYVRLCRNMVAEYALVLFFELERRINSP